MSKSRVSAKERKQLILEAAIYCFANKNYYNTSMSDIASQADISEALIYKHFDSKEELFNEGAYFISASITNNIIRVKGAFSITKKFENLAINFYNYYNDYPHHFIILFNSFSVWKETGIYITIKKKFTLLYRYFTFLIWIGQQKGEYSKKIKPSTIAWQILNSFQSLIFHDLFEFEPKIQKEDVLTIVQVIFSGLKNPELVNNSRSPRF